MGEHGFRFGVVVGQPPTLSGLTGLARRAEDLGYDILLTPDPLFGLDPMTTVAAVAAVTTTLHVGTFVLAGSFRDAKALAWQARSLHSFTEGRFELGLGVGRPGAAEHAASLGREYGTGAQRIAEVASAVAEVKSTEDRPKIRIAGTGPKILELAGQEADAVSFAWAPRTTEADARSIVDRFEKAAGNRAADVERGVNLLAIGGEPAPWLEKYMGTSVAELVEAEAMTVLPGSPERSADTLRRWHEELGISCVSVNSAYLDRFAEVIATLARS